MGQRLTRTGADPVRIQFETNGVSDIEIDEEGNLVLHTGSGKLNSQVRRFTRNPKDSEFQCVITLTGTSGTVHHSIPLTLPVR